MAKKFPIKPANPERICWGCERYCPADKLMCGNGTVAAPHPSELFGTIGWNGAWTRARAPLLISLQRALARPLGDSGPKRAITELPRNQCQARSPQHECACAFAAAAISYRSWCFTHAIGNDSPSSCRPSAVRSSSMYVPIIASTPRP